MTDNFKVNVRPLQHSGEIHSRHLRSSHQKYSIKSCFKKVASLKGCNFIKKRHQTRCFSANLAKLSRTASNLKNIYERLFLTLLTVNFCYQALNLRFWQQSILTLFPRRKLDYHFGHEERESVKGQTPFPYEHCMKTEGFRISSVNVTKSAVSSALQLL